MRALLSRQRPSAASGGPLPRSPQRAAGTYTISGLLNEGFTVEKSTMYDRTGPSSRIAQKVRVCHVFC